MTTTNNLEYGSNGRILFFLVLFLHYALGLAGEPPSSVDGYVRGSVKNSPFLNAVIICFGILAVVGIAIVLYRKWQKKKREEQHARLLRLFEEDDDLEAELGLRD